MKRAVLVAIGDELLSGLRQEGNCCWLAGKLSRAGWNVSLIEVIPDNEEKIQATLNQWIGNSELIVMSGGLGPTHDDRTRTAIASFLGCSLEIDRKAYDEILFRYPTDMRKNLARCSDSQGAVPVLAKAVHNPAGSALGITFTVSGSKVFAFPGVPREFRAMAEAELAEEIRVREKTACSLYIAGWAESLLKDRLAPVIKQTDLHISILPSPGLVEFVIRGTPERIAAAEREVRGLVPADCLPAGTRSLSEAIITRSLQKRITIACAESCTGGMVGMELTSVPGSSSVFLGSAVCYSNQAKKKILSIDDSLLDKYGAVSSQCAEAMADGARRIFEADLAVSVTGIAGPGGGSAEKTVGSVWFGVSFRGKTEAVNSIFPGDREAVRIRSAMKALDILRRIIAETGE